MTNVIKLDLPQLPYDPKKSARLERDKIPPPGATSSRAVPLLVPIHEPGGWLLEARRAGGEPLRFGCYAVSEATIRWLAVQIADAKGCRVSPVAVYEGD